MKHLLLKGTCPKPYTLNPKMGIWHHETSQPLEPGKMAPWKGSGFRIQGFRVQGLGFRVQGSGFRVQGLGFRVQGMAVSLRATACQSKGGSVLGL